ncbi:MAG: cyanophycin synthetase [Burkholderiales bacterium]|nr:cyanophycin synthetase [Burkholderiales bacterium]OJX00724.1 MAG: cyanophycin synthetase [Burkholderiales bacterium 70-64]
MLAPCPQGSPVAEKDIQILEVSYIRGPGRWTYRPVLEAVVDIGGLEDFPSNLVPGFPERLASWLPTLVEHRCSYGERGGFLKRLHEGTWPAHILEHVALELQGLAGLPGDFGRARETPERGVYRVVIRAFQEQVALAALHHARDLVMAAIEDRPYDVAATVEHLHALVDEHYLGPSTSAIVHAAEERHIPAIRLNDGNLVQLGYGARQHRIWTAETDLTSAIAEGVSRDKDLTKQLLQACGVPVPEGRLTSSPQDAWEAAQEIGLPVVVKPYDGNHGRGVFTNLLTREEVESAWHIALEEGSGVIVERFIQGNEHRLLVVGGRMVAASRGEPAYVVGDGRSTVTELIDVQINTDPRRGSTEDFPLNFVRIDTSARIELARQGFDADSVPPRGVRLLIQRNGNVAIDVTAQAHPSVAAAAAVAADVVGLDIAGIDMVIEDISRPLSAQRGAIVEVNAGPGLLMHLKPAAGSPQPVGEAIVDHLFPDGDSGRIPIVGVTGTRSGTPIAQLVAGLLRLSGLRTGLACGDGMYVDERRIVGGDCAHWEPARRLLTNGRVEAAVIENGGMTIVSEGLAYDRCQVGIVTDIDGRARIPEFEIASADQMYTILRTQVDVVLPDGAAVLYAGDPLVARMAPLCDGEVVFFDTGAGGPVVQAHLAAGGRAVVVRAGRIVLIDGDTVRPLVELSRLALEPAGLDAAYRLDDVLAAIGAAWALSLAPEAIRAGLETLCAMHPRTSDVLVA